VYGSERIEVLRRLLRQQMKETAAANGASLIVMRQVGTVPFMLDVIRQEGIDSIDCEPRSVRPGLSGRRRRHPTDGSTRAGGSACWMRWRSAATRFRRWQPPVRERGRAMSERPAQRLFRAIAGRIPSAPSGDAARRLAARRRSPVRLARPRLYQIRSKQVPVTHQLSAAVCWISDP
jgi:hypothetical protein